MNEKIEQLKKLLEKAEKILLINHIKMDPDAFGSLATFYFVLERLGKKVEAVNDFLPPKNFEFLKTTHIFKENLDVKKFNPDLIISFDAGSVNQLGETYTKNKEIFDNKDFVVIDHHTTNSGYGTLNIIDTNSSSTCELLFYILKELGLEKYIEKQEATLLIAGILTDTNVFYNTNTSSKTLLTCSKLLELGADLRNSIYTFFYAQNFNKLKLKAIIFENIQKSEDGKIVWSKITKSDFEKTQTAENDTSGIISELINIEGCEIAFIIYPFFEKNKVSFRSKNFDVGTFSANFEGGGHTLAAGFSSEKSIEELEKEVLEKLSKEIKVY